ncbi:hypothetical protein EC968_008634, partial [Mortierella alpina]
MGASISIVILQSQQLYFLKLDSHTTTPSVTTSADTAHSVLQSMTSLLRSAWLPVTVWALALTSTTLWSGLIKRKQYQHQRQQHSGRTPSLSTLRTSLLLSHLLYGVFWVLLSAIQETQERLFLSPSWSSMTRARPVGGGEHPMEFFTGARSSADLSMLNANYHAQDDGMGSSSGQQMSKHQQQALNSTSRSLTLQSTALPLCVVWYCAIVALGVATGLLATCSGLIEKRLQDEYDERWVALQEEVQGNTGKGDFSPMSSSPSSSLPPKKRAAITRQYSMVQKLTLGLLVLIMFTVEMGFFQWMLSAGDRPETLEKDRSRS